MSYCANCGSKLQDEALFCPKCGTKTQKGADANARYPADVMMREAFTKMGVELERAFNMAAAEMHNAYQKVKENSNQKTADSSQEAAVVCSSCNSKNQAGSIYCRNCGNKLSS
jgi:uncharacterized membrane protein YvbJ